MNSPLDMLKTLLSKMLWVIWFLFQPVSGHYSADWSAWLCVIAGCWYSVRAFYSNSSCLLITINIHLMTLIVAAGLLNVLLVNTAAECVTRSFSPLKLVKLCQKHLDPFWYQNPPRLCPVIMLFFFPRQHYVVFYLCVNLWIGKSRVPTSLKNLS